MGNRLSRITTRTGDDGSTGLADGSRIRKSALRVQVLGDIDEANSVIGLMLSEDLPQPIRERFVAIQNQLFDLGGEISLPGRPAVGEAHLAFLDAAIAAENATLPALKEFILPGGARAAALCHVARTVVRRAERSLVALAQAEAVGADAVRFLNRLSDLLFIEARQLNRAAGQPDVLWKRAETR